MRTLRIAAGLALAALLLPPPVRADVRLPAILSNDMVLQREKPLPIWGWATPGEKVSVTLGEATADATAGADGRWLVKLPPQQANAQPQTLTVKGNNTVKLNGILIGEVWLCSGQSNMEWGVNSSVNGGAEAANAKFPQIRLFHVPKTPAGEPAGDVQAAWKPANNPQNVGGFSAVGFFFGRFLHQELKVPVGLINSSWGGTRIEPWTPPEGFAAVGSVTKFNEQISATQQAFSPARKSYVQMIEAWLMLAKAAAAEGKPLPPMPPAPQHPLANAGSPTGLYNGMIYPLKPFAIRGAIWYQGESNNGEGMLYRDKMEALIAGWRKVWGQDDFPFLFVQLAPYTYGGNNQAGLPFIWEAQTAALGIPNTGMAVTTDISDIEDIHPRNKQDVGLRLARWAMKLSYDPNFKDYSGPLFQSAATEENKIRIKFKHAEGGLLAKGNQPLTWFTIAGEDKKFVPAKAAIDGETVVVEAEGVAKPVAVRFGWDQTAEPNLFNKAGLPASPFRTDKW